MYVIFNVLFLLHFSCDLFPGKKDSFADGLRLYLILVSPMRFAASGSHTCLR